jgi:hypothetical protein
MVYTRDAKLWALVEAPPRVISMATVLPISQSESLMKMRME